MASPPRRMTRARAKKEGIEPDWRINPQWKTPRKPRAKSTKQQLQDALAVGTSSFRHSTQSLELQRPPSPVKICIPAKLPAIRPPETPVSSLDDASSVSDSPRKQTNLGSPVRVRPRTEIKYDNASDKENSHAVTSLKSWTASAKSIQPAKTPMPAAPVRPLEPSPASLNSNNQHTAVTLLSSPVRIFNLQTPGRPIGAARRIPLKPEKPKVASHATEISSSTRPSSFHRNVPHDSLQPVANLSRPTSPSRKLTAPYKPSFSSPGKALKSVQLSTAIPSNHSHLESPSIENESTEWVALPVVSPLPRPTASRKPGTPTASPRPKKLPSVQKASPPRPSSKLGFYVDETHSPSLKGKTLSMRLTSTSTPKFPIQSHSQSQSPTSPEGPTFNSLIPAKTVLLGSLQEFKPIPKIEKWKTPVKTQNKTKTQTQSVRKVCFRTPSMDSPVPKKEAQTIQKSSSILSLAPKRYSTPELSTTPLGTPQSPCSPKVFDLSDTEGSFDLFTPRKLTVLDDMEIPQDVNIKHSGERVVTMPVMEPHAFQAITPQPVVIRPLTPATKTQHAAEAMTPLTIPKESGNGTRDISIPIKEPDYQINPVTPKNGSNSTPSKQIRGEKDSGGPLHGVVAFIDVKTADGDDASAPFAESLRKLGARVVKQWAWNGEDPEKAGVTHVVFKQGGPRTLDKVKCAKGGVKCVGLGWISRFCFSFAQLISRCEAEKVKVDEAPFMVEIANHHYIHKVRMPAPSEMTC